MLKKTLNQRKALMPKVFKIIREVVFNTSRLLEDLVPATEAPADVGRSLLSDTVLSFGFCCDMTSAAADFNQKWMIQ